MKAKKGFTSFLNDIKLPPVQESGLNYTKIKNSAQVFSDAFIFYRQMVKPAAIISLLLASVYTAILLLDGDRYAFNTIVGLEQLFLSPWSLVSYTIENVSQFMLVGELTVPWFLNFITSSVMAYLVLFWVQKDVHKNKNIEYNASFFFNTISSTAICMFGIHFIMLASEGWLFLLMVFLVPVIMVIMATVFNENLNLISAAGRALSIISGNWVVMMGAYIVISVMCLVFLFMATAPIAGFYLGVIANAFPITDLELVRQGFYLFLYSFMLSFLFPLVFIVMSIGFFSFRETKEAASLFKKIPDVGVRKISYGMEAEN